MYVLVDTPAMKTLIKNMNKLGRMLENIGIESIVLIIPYTLRKQYWNILRINVSDLYRSLRHIMYKVRIKEVNKESERRVKTMFENMYLRVKNVLTTRKHLNPEDDATIVTAASIHAHSSSKLYVIAKGEHVSHHSNAKHVIEEELGKPECWFTVLDIDNL